MTWADGVESGMRTELSLETQQRAPPFDSVRQLNLVSLSLSLSGSPLLRAEMALEKLGGGQDYGAEDGPRPRNHLGGRAEAEEEDAH